MTTSIEDSVRDLEVQVDEATAELKKQLHWDSLPVVPKIGLVLGSGLGRFAEELSSANVIPYTKIPHMKPSTVPGHAGQWVYGIVNQFNKGVVVAQGRLHYYEGYELNTVTLPIRMFHELGVEHIILTNAVGSVNPDYNPGDFVLIEDHLNFVGANPLRGVTSEKLGPRFVDLSEPYERDVNQALVHQLQKIGHRSKVHRGVYAALPGPSYETPAEIQMLFRLGADTVGMSTAPECIVARQLGMKVNAVSCVTNYGCGLTKNALSHAEVKEMASKAAPHFCTLLEELVGLV